VRSDKLQPNQIHTSETRDKSLESGDGFEGSKLAAIGTVAT
jgi:hypothetical protein